MAYTITPLRLDEHREALARLWAENMSDVRIASVISDRMRWLYEESPEGRATTMLCLDSGSGEVVGSGSFFQRPTWVGGRRLRAGVLCDFAVTRAHRVAGAALAIQRALVEAARADGLQMLYGHPNAKSVAVFRRIGYRVVGEASAWAKPLRCDHRLRDALRWKEAATVAAMPIDVALRALDRVRSAASPLRLRGEVIPRPDARTDALWKSARGQYGIVGEQSSHYLAWRYSRFTTAECRIFGVFPREEGRLVGFAVYTLNDRKAVLCDLFAEHLDVSAEPLLLHLADHLRRRGAESLSFSYVGPPAFGAQLLSVGFLPRPGKRPLVLHPTGAGEPLPARVMDPASWFMLEGELDI